MRTHVSVCMHMCESLTNVQSNTEQGININMPPGGWWISAKECENTRAGAQRHMCVTECVGKEHIPFKSFLPCDVNLIFQLKFLSWLLRAQILDLRGDTETEAKMDRQLLTDK